MAKVFARVTNMETGEIKEVRTAYAGLQMAVTSKLPTLNNFNTALCMAYIALHPEALKLKGPELLEKATAFYMKWDYEDWTEEEAEESAPLEADGETLE